MMAKFSRNVVLLALLLACAAPAPVFASSAAMREASQVLLGKGLAASDTNRARRLLEQSIVADPANAAALSALGHLYQTGGKADLARKYYGLALSTDPTEPSALFGAAELDIADGKTADARDRLRILKVVCPACSQTHDLENKLGSNATAPLSSHP